MVGGAEDAEALPDRAKPRSRYAGSGACVVSVRSPGYGFAGSSAPFAAGIGSVAR